MRGRWVNKGPRTHSSSSFLSFCRGVKALRWRWGQVLGAVCPMSSTWMDQLGQRGAQVSAHKLFHFDTSRWTRRRFQRRGHTCVHGQTHNHTGVKLTWRIPSSTSLSDHRGLMTGLLHVSHQHFSVFLIKIQLQNISIAAPFDLYFSCTWDVWLIYGSGYIFKVVNHRVDDAFGEMKVHFCAAMFLTPRTAIR